MGSGSNSNIDCIDICTGKAKNIRMTQCRNADGQIVSMKKIGTCGEEETTTPLEKLEDMDDIKVVDAEEIE